MYKKLISKNFPLPPSRSAAAAGCVLLVAACATAPPPPSQPSGRHGVRGELFVCGGTSVSNAPPADGSGRIAWFEPTAEIRGLTLARAPTYGCLSSGYGVRPGTGRMHNGVDLYTAGPAPVYTAAAGEIEFAGDFGDYGETIVIGHGSGVQTRYAHLSGYARGIRKGAYVRAGEVIGDTGRTGNATAIHLHYEIIVDGQPENPLTVGY